MASPAFLLEGTKVPSPCFVVDLDALRANMAILDGVQRHTGARVLLALKCFAAWRCFPLLSRALGQGGTLWGTCASSVDEARLGREDFGGEVHAFAAAWSEAEMQELVGLVDAVSFNSPRQWEKFRGLVQQAPRPIECGLRINPEHSEGTVPMYDPCSPTSRLGIRRRNMPDGIMETGISGLHFHTLCEQGADALARTVEAVERQFAPFLERCQWINCGGGHHITRKGYDLDLLCETVCHLRDTWGAQIYLEPGEACALDAGWLVATVLDVTDADMPLVQIDSSAACHMPDVLEMPYTPRILYEHGGALVHAGEPGEKRWTCRIGGKSCLAGDVVGEYSFEHELAEGERLIFEDMAIYSMVKTNTFNGLRLPGIGLAENRADAVDFRLVREFGYSDFRTRLS